MFLNKLFLLFGLIASTQAVKVKRCAADLESYISNIELVPEKFSQGDNIILSFDLKNPGQIINNGFVTYEIFHNNHHYYPQIDRLCDVISCPVYNKTTTIKLPIKIPEYDDNVTMVIELSDFNQMTFACIKIQLNTGIWRRIKNMFVPSDNPVNLTKKLRGNPSEAPVPAGNRTVESPYNYTFIASLNTHGANNSISI